MDKELEQVLIDRFEAWEIADFLQISTEEFVDFFRHRIEENYEDVCEWAGFRRDDSLGSDE